VSPEFPLNSHIKEIKEEIQKSKKREIKSNTGCLIIAYIVIAIFILNNKTSKTARGIYNRCKLGSLKARVTAIATLKEKE
jgi:hypothetical protein